VAKSDKESEDEMEQWIFQIISYAGDAKSNTLLALDHAGKDDFDSAEKCLKEADEEILKAHELHTKLLQKFSSGEKVEVNILLTHAQDHLMNAILARDLICRIVKIMKNNRQNREGNKIGK
jgi:PTS system cellobiose-specific IIA component